MNKTYFSFFRKHLFTLLIPMFIPLIVLGTLSNIIIQRYVKEEINQQNANLLKQSKENIEVIFNEVDSIKLYFMSNAVEFVRLERLLEKPSLELDDYRQLASVKSFIDAPAIAKPYIDSIYVYPKNSQNRFITTVTGGVEEIGQFYDNEWYDSFSAAPSEKQVWTEARTVRKYGFDQFPTDLITVYKRIALTDRESGVIVLNIPASYIKNVLNNLYTWENQALVIVNDDNQVVLQNQPYNYLTESDIRRINTEPDAFFPLETDHGSFMISKVASEKYGWTFVSVTPSASLYQIPFRLSVATAALLLVSLVIGAVLAYLFTRKNYSQIKAVVNLLESAENGRPLPSLPGRIRDVYSFIMYKILKRFIEQNYLQVQLSERKYRAKTMELIALQSQLNPHFLFNTLETIYWKVASITGKPGEVNHMLANLADILRYSLDDQNKPVILQKEIQYTLSYLDIQKARYKDKFEVVWDFDEEAQTYNVIKLILQPLIENSIYHGIKEKDGFCRIKIKIAAADDGIIHLSVTDNGVGMSRKRLAEVRALLDSDLESSANGHIGLYNTHKRLKLTYGEEFGLTVRSKRGWGTMVRMRIPV